MNDSILSLQKFKSYLLQGNLISRLQAKYNSLKKALGDDLARLSAVPLASPGPAAVKPAKPRRVGKTPIVGRPKVFGCNLEEYVEVRCDCLEEFMVNRAAPHAL